MTRAPITLLFFTTTRGHFSRRTDWKLTLDDIDRQLPLSTFGARLASLKVTPGDEEIGAVMQRELEARGFRVIAITADWQRGHSHQVAYCEDAIRLSRQPEVHAHPYVWWIEDDGAIRCHDGSLARLLADSTSMLAADPDLLTVRLRRRADDRGPVVPVTYGDPRLFHSEDLNFQPFVARARDLQLAALCVERNPEAQATVQIERLWRVVFDSFSRSRLRHAVWECEHAEVWHLGVPQAEHEAACRQLGLQPL